VEVEAHAFWLRAPGCGEIRPVTVPAPGRDEVMVRTLHSGVSRGTETLVFRGGVPADQRDAMRAPFQEGDFPGPVKYGYLSVGAVEEGPAELRGRGRPVRRRPTGRVSGGKSSRPQLRISEAGIEDVRASATQCGYRQQYCG
jgi:hypothetical protein